MINFPTEYESAHVKVLILNNQESSTKLTFIMSMKKRMRSYTVLKFNIEKSELIIDFAINDHKGLVADWAANAKIGDYIGIGGPGPTKYKGLEANWHLFAGDITAIPVIASTIEKLPEDAIGYAFLQVPSEIDKQIITTPKGINIIWVINPNPFLNELYSHLEKFKWLNKISSTNSQKPMHLAIGKHKYHISKNRNSFNGLHFKFANESLMVVLI